jgi:anti-sigma regulatory factor (Ser/Thr protein kinase)
VIHGNGENSCERVYVECRCYIDGEVSITVRDEGLGFDMNTVPDPTTSENRLLRHARVFTSCKLQWTKSLSKRTVPLCTCRRNNVGLKPHRGEL